MASLIHLLDGHNVVSPTHGENNTGKWLCDGRTSAQWMLECYTLAKKGDRSGNVEESAAISGALQSLDNNEETL